MQTDIQKTLLTRDEIQARVKQVARSIRDRFEALARPDAPIGAEITIVPILTGSMIFAADLIRELPLKMKIHMVSISSYPGASTSSKGALMQTELAAFADDLAGHHVLLVDDILDSGQTLELATRKIAAFKPASLQTCVLLRKNRPEAMAFPVDYVCFDIPDEFVVGYGLDYAGYYRNLPTISTLTPQAIENHR
jgi:hypoxanthine phosphoribosyltransferase